MFEIYVAVGIITLLYLLGKLNKPAEVELAPLKKDASTQTLYEPLLMVEPMNDLMQIDTPSPGSLSDMDVESDETSSPNYIMKSHFC